MHYEIAATLVFSISLLGMGVIISRKIPVLVTLSEIPKGESFFFRLKRKTREFLSRKNFSYEIFLQKIIHKIRILTLKADNKTFNWLRTLRERYRKKKIKEVDNYWEEIRNKTK